MLKSFEIHVLGLLNSWFVGKQIHYIIHYLYMFAWV